jgi:F-type H+-transporting ATPase subunit epsilon
MTTIHVDIVSLEQAIFSGEASAVFVTGTLGELGIYPGHTQLLSSIRPGHVRILHENQEEDIFFVKGGILEVQRSVTILADTVIRATDLDEQAALETKLRAEKLLSNRKSDFDITRAAVELAEALAQIQTIQKFRKKYKV